MSLRVTFVTTAHSAKLPLSQLMLPFQEALVGEEDLSSKLVGKVPGLEPPRWVCSVELLSTGLQHLLGPRPVSHITFIVHTPEITAQAAGGTGGDYRVDFRG